MPQDKLAQIHTIGVISAIGDHITQTEITFGQHSKVAPIRDWGLDGIVIGRASEILRKRFEVRPVAYDETAFLPEKVWSAPAEHTTPRWPEHVGEAVRAGVSTKGLDAYLVIVSTENTDAVGGSAAMLEGLGLHHHHLALLVSPVSAYAIYWVALVDGHTFQVIGGGPAVIQARTITTVELAGIAPERVEPADIRCNATLAKYNYPIVRSTSDWWAAAPEAMSEAQKHQVKDAFTAMLEVSMIETLQRLNLGVSDLKIVRTSLLGSACGA